MIKDNLHNIQASLPEGVTLVAVSKFHPVERLREAYDAGQRVFAESRPQELAAKVPLMPSDVEWHFIGHLQTNKLKLVLPYVSLVQSVDSAHLLEAIERWGEANGRTVDVLLEVHISSDAAKQGFAPEELMAIIDKLASACGREPSLAVASRPLPRPSAADPSLLRGREVGPPKKHVFLGYPRGWPRASDGSANPATLAYYGHIRLRGLMGMATLTEDESIIEGDFARLEALFGQIRAAYPELTEFDQLSIGMSGDWPIAVRHGATMVRIGTDIFGPREY